MNGYVVWVTENPIVSAALQFALLGTLGEILSASLRNRSLSLPGNAVQMIGKLAAWALLGIIIKYGFAGMKGFTTALVEHRLLPQFMAAGVGYAFAVSVFTNLLFGPQMMFFHRLEDNLIMREWNMEGLIAAWWTLIWFWIPAHTVTFSLSTPYQIGLAAVWSVVLGLILGLANKRAVATAAAA